MAPKKKASGRYGARGNRTEPCNHRCRDTCAGHTCCAESRQLLAAAGNAANPAAIPAVIPGVAAVAAPLTAGPSRAAKTDNNSKAARGRKRKQADADVAGEDNGIDHADSEQPEDAAAVQAPGPLALGGSSIRRKTAGNRKRRRADEAAAAAIESGDERDIAGEEQPGVATERPEQAEEPSATRSLADEKHTTHVTLKDGDARLTIRLQISIDDENRSRLAYHAEFLVSYDIEAEQDEDGDYAGYINSWRIDKPTDLKRNAKASWADDLLPPKAARGKSEIVETAKCLQALFNRDGSVTKLIKDAEVRKSLEDESLIFIGMIYFEDGFRGKGLLAPALGAYYTAVRQLPEWFAFTGNMVIVPARPVEYKTAWGRKSDDEVEKTLIGVYEKVGYTRWVTADVSTGPGTADRVFVMGRSVQ